ncbi:hypothetical protein JCM3775_002226 [Rhodotorula graminis]
MVDADVDDQIEAILRRATQLADTLPPLYSWDDLCDTIASEDLAALNRHPELEKLYVHEFNPLIRRAYGSTEAYLRLRLGWAAPAPDEQDGQGEGEGEGKGNDGEQRADTSRRGRRKEYWERDDKVNVRRNDWKYSMPRDVRHYVVWVDLPLFSPLLCIPPPSVLPASSSPSTSAPASGTSTPSGPSHRNPLASRADGEPGAALVAPTKGTWDHVSEKGLGGLTGAAQRRWRRRRGLPEEEAGAARGQEDGPEREVRAFVERRWPEEDAWETAWFANPPALQSVPGLAHFHVLARQVLRDEQDAASVQRGEA